MKFLIHTYGCQMNVRDSEAVEALLLAAGHEKVATEAEAELVIVNSCTVRQKAEEKAVGKAGNMIAAYYSRGCDASSIFDGLKIARAPSYREHLNRYNVIKLDVGGLLNTSLTGSVVKDATNYLREEFQEQFPDIPFGEADGIAQCMMKVFRATGQTFVIVLDEYDVMVRDTSVTHAQFDEYLRFLNGLFKNEALSGCISLAYLTGILPIVRDRIQSKLNVFTEYTMANARQLSPYVGFTRDEVERLCRENGMDFREVTRWYDGYRMADGSECYNPKSVVEALTCRRCKGYWTATGHFDAIRNYVIMDFDGLREDVNRMMAGESVPVDVRTYLNTMKDFRSRDDVLTYLIHLGYLAFRYTAPDAGECWIPNLEIRREWARALRCAPGFERVMSFVNASARLVEDTLAMKADAVARGLDAAHRFVCSNYSYSNEQALQSALCLAYFHAMDRFLVLKEPELGRGRADILMIPIPQVAATTPAVIVEMKRNSSADSALQQIREKRYFAGLKDHVGEILFVGIDYDEMTKKHTCAMERFVKES